MKKVVFGDEAWGMCHRQWEDLWTPLAGGGSGDRIKLVSNFQLGTRKFQLPSTIGMQHQFTHPLSVSRLRAPPTIVLLVRNCVEAFLHLMFAGLLQLPPESVSAFLYPPWTLLSSSLSPDLNTLFLSFIQRVFSLEVFLLLENRCTFLIEFDKIPWCRWVHYTTFPHCCCIEIILKGLYSRCMLII